ncbi:MAG: hypothetical protein NXY57DRAFT_970277 [Lentinula lateritia]|nr:MAG: hypothetical protein NXY57DRAFT_970277 [Lentinula lateritia]
MFSSTTDIAIITLLCLVYLLSVKISTRTRLSPNTPPEVPYLIPWLGHGISFALRREDLMKKSRARFGPVYNLLVAGRVITVVSSPELMADLVGRSPKQVRAPEEDLLQATSGLKSRLPYVTMILRRSIYGIIARRLTKHTMGPVTVPMNQKLFSSLNNLANQDGIAVFHLDELVQQSMYRASVSVLFGWTNGCIMV